MLKQILRLFRRKSVLFTILISSFTYSMVMLFGKPVMHSIHNLENHDETLDIDRVKSRFISLRQKSEANDAPDTNVVPNVDFLKDVDQPKEELIPNIPTDGVTQTESCRNSVQGKVLIADDRGYICSRRDLSSSGCCVPSKPSSRPYSCDTCTSNDCCAIYEHCISCCMHPEKRPLLQKIIKNDSVKLGVIFSSVTDHFEFCLAKCRTSSQSVHHENSYRDPRAKHCYGENLPFAKTSKEVKQENSKKDPPNKDKQR